MPLFNGRHPHRGSFILLAYTGLIILYCTLLLYFGVPYTDRLLIFLLVPYAYAAYSFVRRSYVVVGLTGFGMAWWVIARHFQQSLNSIHNSHLTLLWLAMASAVIGEMLFRATAARRRMMARLRANEERYRTIVENTNDFVWRSNAQGIFTFVSPSAERMLGYRVEDLLGQNARVLLTEEGIAKMDGIMQHLQANPASTNSFHIELPHICKDGRELVGEIVGSPVFKTDGTLLECVGVTRDISGRKRAEEERRKMESQFLQTQKLESMGVLAGGIAHDFNNILTSVLGNIDLARLQLDADSPLTHYLNEVETAANRAAGLARQMLAYSGKGRFVIEPLDLNRLAKELGQIFRATVAKGIALNYELAPSLPAIDADRSQILQLLMNLVSNAAEAIGDQGAGRISIRTCVLDSSYPFANIAWPGHALPAGDYVCLEVTDDGCGMNEDVRKKIFDPFFTTKFTGRGLGLSAVLGIVNGHHGGIKVYSEPGLGSTIKVFFPVSHSQKWPEPGPQAEAAKPGSLGAILFVDDEEPVRIMARDILVRSGYTVLLATNGQEALDLYRQHAGEIECIVMDFIMPGMDGDTALRELRAIDDKVPVILSSGFNQQDLTHRLSSSKGFSAFLQKPYPLEKLVQLVRETTTSALTR